MKKNILNIILLGCLLSSCEFIAPSQDIESEKQTEEESVTPSIENSETSSVQELGEYPKIRNNDDFKFKLVSENSDDDKYIVVSAYDFIKNTTASDKEDGDLTDRIKYEVVNYYTKEKVRIIQLTNHGKYQIIYSVTDSSGQTTTDINYIIVGSPNTMLDENGNPKEILSVDDELDAITESYELIFNEEFNYTGAPGTVQGENDYNAYRYETGGGGWGNQEVQIYEQNTRTCYVSDGALKISVVKDGNNYYSARLNTTSAFSKDWTYGLYEVYAKVPRGNGPWPAIWMMPNTSTHGTWPKSGEIDIMETSQYYYNKILGTVHTQEYNHMNGTQKGGQVMDSSVYTTYHRYAIEWLPDRIKFYFDDNNYFTFRPSLYINPSIATVTTDMWPFDHAFHFIFNIAMGGMMGGDISNTLFDNGNEVAMYIDKINVYQSTYVNQKYLKR